MAFSSQLTEKVTAMRAEIDALLSKEEATDEDLIAASKMNEELEALEKKEAQATALERAQAERKKQERQPLRVINTGATEAKAASFDDEFDYERKFGHLQKPPDKTWFEEFVASYELKQAARSGDFRNIRAEITGGFALASGHGGLNAKAAGDPIMQTQFAPRMTDTTIIPHYWPPANIIPLINVVNIPLPGLRYFQATIPISPEGTAFIAEGASKPEIQPRWTTVDAVCELIADWTTVTLMALDDLPSLRAAIDFDLRTSLEYRLDYVLLNGSGTTPQPRGILNFAGVQNAGAFTAGTLFPDQIAGGIQAVMATGAGVPNAVVMNPTDYWKMRISKASTTGVYYFGAPYEVGVPNIFGLPVVQDPNIAVGTALVGDFRRATFYQRMGVTFIVGLKNDDILKNQQTIVCEMRGFLAITRPQAFCIVQLKTPWP